MSDLPVTDLAQRRFTIGTCISLSMAVFGRNFGPLAVLGLVLSLPILAFSIFEPSGKIDFIAGSNAEVWTFVGGVLVALFVNALISAAVIYGCFQDLRGARASFGECLTRGLISVFPVVTASILGTLAIALGSIFLLIPGIIIAMMIWVYIPTIVVEGQGIIASFGRSRALTDGHKWQIFGLTIVVQIGGEIVQFAVGMLLPLLTLGSIYLPVIALYALNALISIFTAITTAVGYYLLRAEKEGIDIDQIAKVFD